MIFIGNTIVLENSDRPEGKKPNNLLEFGLPMSAINHATNIIYIDAETGKIVIYKNKSIETNRIL